MQVTYEPCYGAGLIREQQRLADEVQERDARDVSSIMSIWS